MCNMYIIINYLKKERKKEWAKAKNHVSIQGKWAKESNKKKSQKFGVWGGKLCGDEMHECACARKV